MKRFLKILILILLGITVYQFRTPLLEQFLLLQNNFSAFFIKAPCTEPIPYTLGTFNTQFGISKDYFLSALLEAEAIWEKPFGKNLFVYAPTDSDSHVLKINLIYDYRQQATGKLAGLGIVVKDNRASYDMLKTKFIALKAELAKAENDYSTRVQNFNDEQKTYNQNVQYWNTKGGVSKQEYDKLQLEKSSLEMQSFQLQVTQASINEMVNEINAFVVALNRLVAILNISVAQYNTVNGARGESFEEGVYYSDGTNRAVDIYEFSSRPKLVRVLAHELGHALGIEHLDDPKAIMYKFNQSNNETLTEADLLALKTKCGIK
jgi:predicted Zn-dependent protease